MPAKSLAWHSPVNALPGGSTAKTLNLLNASSLIHIEGGLFAASTSHTFQVQARARGRARGHAPDHAGVAVEARVARAVLQLHDHALLGPRLCGRPAHHQRHLLRMAPVAEAAACMQCQRCSSNSTCAQPCFRLCRPAHEHSQRSHAHACIVLARRLGKHRQSWSRETVHACAHPRHGQQLGLSARCSASSSTCALHGASHM